MEIIHAYGYDAQSRQCIEEMAELTQAINKFWRKQLKCGQIRVNQVSEAIGWQLSDMIKLTNFRDEVENGFYNT